VSPPNDEPIGKTSTSPCFLKTENFLLGHTTFKMMRYSSDSTELSLKKNDEVFFGQHVTVSQEE
jgi:hypothetical protein